MIVTDPIADMLGRIRSANTIGHDSLRMPTSKLRVSIADILTREGYIGGYRTVAQTDEEKRKTDLGGQQLLEIDMRYTKSRERVITGLKRVSKPGLRVYKNSKDLPRVMGGLGIAVISTSKGVMTDKDARREKVGGEILCYVW